mmetsp:Transcript_59254/g.144871  ORF Transcript_59254/g.144871 Transcript_59254/m.144871 type:complete len:276 (-) Transcript_59254:1770-2597(-)
MYSDMSIRMRASSLSNMNSDNALHNSVFPTPVGPRKIRLPMGLLGSLSPALDLWTACVTTSIASSCPTTRCLKLSPILRIRLRSLSNNLPGGMPVQVATTAAISSATTSSRSMRSSSSISPRSSAMFSSLSSSSCKGGSFAYFNSAALFRSNSRSHFSISNSTAASSVLMSLIRSTPPFSAIHLRFNSSDCFRRSASSTSIPAIRFVSSVVSLWALSSISKSDWSDKRSISNWMIRRSISSNTVGFDVNSFFNLAQASSTRSIALSGKNRSGMYR